MRVGQSPADERFVDGDEEAGSKEVLVQRFSEELGICLGEVFILFEDVVPSLLDGVVPESDFLIA
jgi:hypothetical protein